MAEPQHGAISAAFPAPPPFYKSFTDENLLRLQQHIDPSSQASISTLRSTGATLSPIADLTALPTELRDLVPPRPPVDGRYRSFGTVNEINPPPPALQTIPTRENLLQLTDRLMRLFHRYVQIMATNPTGELWVPQWEEIKKTFEEVHGIINEYRPHEARESLILRYEDQIRQVKDETVRVKGSVERARTVIKDLGIGGLGDGQTAVNGEAKGQQGKSRRPERGKDLEKAKEQLVWKAIEKEVGRA